MLLTGAAHTKDSHVVNTRLEIIVLAKLCPQSIHDPIVQVYDLPTVEADQMMVWLAVNDLIDHAGLSQIGLRHDPSFFEPLQDAIDGRLGEEGTALSQVSLYLVHCQMIASGA